MAGFAGFRYSELLGQILAAAVERYNIVGKPVAVASGQGQADVA
jgi:D-alanine-D-alanine ligase